MALIYFTCKDKLEAEFISRKLLEEKLIACANIIQNIESVYLWKNRIEEDRETLVICKTLKKKTKAAIKRIEKIHSYNCPAITVIDSKNNAKCNAWLKDVLK